MNWVHRVGEPEPVVRIFSAWFVANPRVTSVRRRPPGCCCKSTEKERLLENRKKEAEKIRQDTDRTHRLYLDGEISAEAFGKLFQPIEERQKQLEEELPRLQAEIGFLRMNSFSADQVMNDATYLQESWPGLERTEKRKIVECITNRIVVSKEEITIDLCYLPSSKEITKRDWSLGDSNP